LDTEIQKLEDQRDFFSIFHDGDFTTLQRKGNDIEFQVEIAYLAEIRDPTYTTFSVALKNCHYCALEIWDKMRDEDINVINTYIKDMEIRSANCENNQIHVICADYFQSSGGYFIFSCERVVVFDEGGKEITLDELKDIATRYWKKFSQRHNEGTS
jgi:hypothetical protein